MGVWLMPRFAILVLVAVLLLGCVSTKPNDLRTYSDQDLCDLINPSLYASESREKINVLNELDRRGVICEAQAPAV